jgi:aspartyl-tRNA(Asn)/glutamyl-tRNA(Gln) amidotransferase subunit A
MVLAAISGRDFTDPGNAGRAHRHAPAYFKAPKEIRIGYSAVDFDEWADPELRPELKKGLEALKGLGVSLREVEIPDFPYGATLSTILAGEAGSIFEDLIRSGKVDELADQRQIAGLKSYLDVPATEYLRAMRVRGLIQQAFKSLFLDVDMLVTPTRLSVATPLTQALDGGGDGPRPAKRGMSAIIPAGNLAGLPALSLPCGFANGLPVAISLVGRPFYENHLVGLGQAFQKDTTWHKQQPKV